MNINLTLFAQAASFALFIWFTVKFVWPPIIRAIEQRQKTIADGLAAAERGQQDLELASKRASEVIREAKDTGAGRSSPKPRSAAQQLVEEAKSNAKAEGDRILAAAKAEIEQEVSRAKDHAARAGGGAGRQGRGEDPAARGGRESPRRPAQRRSERAVNDAPADRTMAELVTLARPYAAAAFSHRQGARTAWRDGPTCSLSLVSIYQDERVQAVAAQPEAHQGDVQRTLLAVCGRPGSTAQRGI